MKRKIRKWLYGKCPGFAGAFPYYGVTVYFPKNSLIFRLACEQGVYEHENIKILLSLVKSDTVYFDVGANIGLMSIPILRSKPDCKVVSFEPSPNSMPYLITTREHSTFQDRWTIVGKGAGSSVGIQRFFAASAEMGAFDGFAESEHGQKNEIVIPVTTIDAEWEVMGRPSVSMIKIDIEGAELEALRGALNCIAQAQPSILIECNLHHLQANKLKPNDLLSFLNNISYTAFSLPHLIPIGNTTVFYAQMLITESFLLLPEQK